MSSNKNARDHTDPTTYDVHHQRFNKQGVPSGTAAWIERAHEVSKILAEDAPTRDIANKSPHAEISLLKSSGLLKVMGPKQYGGGGEPWSTAYKVIREVAKGDGSLGMLLGYHLLWSTTANVVGTDEQRDGIQRVIIENNVSVESPGSPQRSSCADLSKTCFRHPIPQESDQPLTRSQYFCGGAVNPRDNDLNISTSADGNDIVFLGAKNFNTGGVISDLTVLEGVYEGTEDHIFTFAKTDQQGIQFAHNWDALGMRLTESGSVKINDVHVPWTDALGWSPETKKPIPEVLGIPFASLLLPT